MKIVAFGVPQRKCDALASSMAFESAGFGEEINFVEGDFFEHVAAHYIIKTVVAAEQKGYLGALVGCFFDPGVQAARELVEIPVVGAGEANMHLAAQLTAGRFSVLVGQPKWIPGLQRNAMGYGLAERISSWRVFGLSLRQILADPENTYSALLAAGRKSVQEDGADVLCLGCTALAEHASRLEADLGVRVIDPTLAAIRTAEFRAGLWKDHHVSHSKRGAYECPPQEDLSNAYAATYTLSRKILYHFKNKFGSSL